ncbi:MAG: hydantoin utilization protein [Synechococcus sp. SB0673_bin_10]|nr:hydantoin utilization protein [Synechococcus sp. SB0665_bin_28]MYF19279.1 hydantoin utilization protein [Synechococcus sp. SB0677_bin_5]MYG64647.1 hydantoin utilization protein [Synechococcus sp. SB0675_bin_7]MYI72371.1 hydantoin utilization protein [Synechococcus sp. SB0673_bin_10]MYK84930.1 hydantoin utilization protein [Synechococcus sp. SB0669_bin_7]
MTVFSPSRSLTVLRGRRVAPLMMGGIAALTAATPGWTHHPFEGVQPQDLNLLQGLVSGFGHPLLGVDHLVFLLAIVVMTALTTQRWVLPLLASGLAGSGLAVLLGATPEPNLGLALELVVSLSLAAAGLVHAGWLPAWLLLPLMGVHGFLLGEPMIGAEPTPLAAYGLGLLLSQGALLLLVTALLTQSRPILALLQRLRMATTTLLVALGVFWTVETLWG